MPLPCDCCPVGGSQCATVATPFTSVSQTVAEAGWAPVNLAATADGVTATTTLSGYNTLAGNTPSTTLRVEYVLPAQNRVRGLRLWNQCGGDLNDADGLGTFDAEFYAGATLLHTQNCIGGNGAAPYTFLFPTGTELDGVTRVVLRNLSKQTGSTVAPLWRELQLLAFQTVFSCRRRSGAVEWYDLSGNLVPSVNVIPCDGESVNIPVLLTATPSFFGDGPDPAGEKLCLFSTPPDVFTSWTQAGSCFDPPLGGNPPLQWTTPITALEFEYGTPPNTSGGAFLVLTSPDLGTVTWPNTGQLNPGQTVLSNALTAGRRVLLTYLSGPLGSAPSGSVQTTSGNQVWFHRNSTDGVTAPIRIRLDFLPA